MTVTPVNDVSDDFTNGAVLIKLSRNGVVSTISSGDIIIVNDAIYSWASCQTHTEVRLQAGEIVWVDVVRVNSSGAGSNVINGSFHSHLVFAE